MIVLLEHCNCGKKLKKLVSMEFVHEILHIQNDNYKEQSFPLKQVSIFLKVMELKLIDTKIFVTTLCYDNVDDYDILSCNFILLKMYFG